VNASNSDKPPKPAKRDAVALWKAIENAAIEDDMEEILAMSDDQLDAHIQSQGGDPAAIRARGRAFVNDLIEKRARTEWHGEAATKLGAFREIAAASRTTEKLPRAELRRRLDVARNDPRFATPIAALFRQKTVEASTDEELQALLDQIELLRKLDEQ